MSVALDFVKSLEYQLILHDMNLHLMIEKEKNKFDQNKSAGIKKLFEEQKEKFLKDEIETPVVMVSFC